MTTPAPRRLKVGVVGAGMIAQIMHLPYLAELREHFQLQALCDASPSVVGRCGSRFGVERCFTDWHELLEEDLDAVLVLTSGSHAPIAAAALAAGRHVLVEKPMCYSVAEGVEMIETASRSGVVLMVGYPKRYDPAYRRLREDARDLHDLRFVRLTTLEAPPGPYLQHYELVRGDDVPPALVERWRADGAVRVRAAIGDAPSPLGEIYERTLLDTMVHEFNLLRGLLGEPTALRFVSLRTETVTAVLDFSGVECVVAWVDLPGLAHYEMEVCMYGPSARLRLAFPSPYLKNAPRVVETETGGRSSVTRREILSHQDPFRLELLEFHRAVVDGGDPHTSGRDGLRDVALCQSVIEASRTGAPVPRPTEVRTAGTGP